ncbi:MAG: nucleotidyl transferase AbiEii/AbiGii toxin family protein [Candidatus Omnitrophota bacterium]|nr:nucleotidyl transferase AbiEii/AbiGii toxin family protein [Candidatus Omnitrophota bacterium]
MLDVREIQSFYPAYLRGFKKNLLREYLQYKILEIIFDSEFGEKLAFMGGTAIHIVHSSVRFSEDLDFDNIDLTKKEFGVLIELIQRKLNGEGYNVEYKNVFSGAYHAYLKFTNILFENKLSGHRQEKLLIQIDMEPQRFKYQPQKALINKFDVFLRINAVSADILLAQKIVCIFRRKRTMGRDFYDAVFLMGRTKPHFGYLCQKLKIKDARDLKYKLSKACEKLDFKKLAADVEPFLFDSKDAKKVRFFAEYIKEEEF